MNQSMEIFQKVKEVLTSFYDAVCQIQQCSTVSGKDVADRLNWRMAWENVPCHLDFDVIHPVVEGQQGALVHLDGILFVDSDIKIFPGSRILVYQDNQTWVFESSGEPAVYQTHQEVPLRLAEMWA